jgi:Xaa-Pro aminopeptidase
VFFAYAVVTQEHAILFVDQAQVNTAVKDHISAHAEIKPYEAFFPYLKELAKTNDLSKDFVS